MKVRHIQVTQTRIFESDALPFFDLLTQSARNRITDAFHFDQVAIPGLRNDGGVPMLDCKNGEFTFDEVTYHVVSIVVNLRKITIVVHGDSNVAAGVFGAFSELIKEADSRPESFELTPIVFTEETLTAMDATFSIEGLLRNSPISANLDLIKSKFQAHGTKLDIVPSSVVFSVRYRDIPQTLIGNHITLLDKELRIETRIDTDTGDHQVFVASPNSSDIHLSLVAELERSINE